MTLKPCRNWVVIAPDLETVTPGGIVLPEKYANAAKPQTGTVVAVGDGAYCSETGKRVRSCFCKAGDKVLYIVYGANIVRIGGEERICVEDTQVMGVFEATPS